jgi:hypothetical protein
MGGVSAGMGRFSEKTGNDAGPTMGPPGGDHTRPPVRMRVRASYASSWAIGAIVKGRFQPPEFLQAGEARPKAGAAP